MCPPLVSVIIPTFRHRDFILPALNSVFEQTFTDYEVIVVNDGSPDDTAQVLRPLRDAGRIKYIEQANAGQASARNRGLNEARGKFIAFLDDDDLWPPDKLEWQSSTLLKRDDLVAIAGNAAIFEHSISLCRPRQASPLMLTCKSLFLRNPISSPGQMLIRSTTIRQLGGFKPELWGVDDLDLWMRLTLAGRIEIHIRTALYYRLHADNASRDHARMLENCDRVFQQNLPLLHGVGNDRFKRLAYLRLYKNLGSQIVQKAKIHAKRGQVLKALAQLMQLKVFFQRIGFSQRLVRALFRDLLPWTFTHRRSATPPVGSPAVGAL
jgi:glycosyltransferase involved in cell wall biosynthesis